MQAWPRRLTHLFARELEKFSFDSNEARRRDLVDVVRLDPGRALVDRVETGRIRP